MTLVSRVLGALLAVSLALATTAALAAWRDDIKALRVGVVGGTDPAYRLATLEPFRVYLQDKTGIPVEIVPAPTYDALIDAQAGGHVDYAIYSATAYATAVLRCDCIEAFAAPVAADGALGFYSILVARSGDSIADLAGAGGKRLGLGPADSVAGSIVPRHAFAADGIDPDAYFLAVTEYPTPEEAMAALLRGEVDIAAAWSSLTGSEPLGYAFGTLDADGQRRHAGDGPRPGRLAVAADPVRAARAPHRPAAGAEGHPLRRAPVDGAGGYRGARRGRPARLRRRRLRHPGRQPLCAGHRTRLAAAGEQLNGGDRPIGAPLACATCSTIACRRW